MSQKNVTLNGAQNQANKLNLAVANVLNTLLGTDFAVGPKPGNGDAVTIHTDVKLGGIMAVYLFYRLVVQSITDVALVTQVAFSLILAGLRVKHAGNEIAMATQAEKLGFAVKLDPKTGKINTLGFRQLDNAKDKQAQVAFDTVKEMCEGLAVYAGASHVADAISNLSNRGFAALAKKDALIGSVPGGAKGDPKITLTDDAEKIKAGVEKMVKAKLEVKFLNAILDAMTEDTRASVLGMRGYRPAARTTRVPVEQKQEADAPPVVKSRRPAKSAEPVSVN